jgi:hypothetical protein
MIKRNENTEENPFLISGPKHRNANPKENVSLVAL